MKRRRCFSLWSSATLLGCGLLYDEGNVVVTWLKEVGHCYRLLANLNEALVVVPGINKIVFLSGVDHAQGADESS